MFSGRSLRALTALAFSSFLSLGCSVSEQLQGYLGSIDSTKPTLTLSSAPAVEGSNGEVVLTLSQALSSNLSISFSVSDVTATAGVDYTSVTSPVVILAGQVSATVSFATSSDATYEGDETFTFTVVPPSEVNVVSPSQAVTLQDASPAPVIEFSVAASNVAEGVGTAQIVVTLTPASQVVAAVPFTLTGTATDPADYTLAASTLTFTSGETSKTLSVSVVEDLTEEPDETIILTLGVPTNSTLGTNSVHTMTIGFSDTLPFTWTGKAGDASWLTAGNWSTNVVPGSGDVARFSDACVNCNANLASVQSVGGFIITSTAQLGAGLTCSNGADFTINGATTIDGGFFNAMLGCVVRFKDNVTVNNGTFISGSNTTHLYFEKNLTVVDGVAYLGYQTHHYFVGTANSSLDLNGIASFGHMHFEKTGVGANINIVGDFTAQEITINSTGGGNTIDGGYAKVTGNVNVQSGAGGSATIELTSTSLQTVTGVAGAVLPNLLLNKTSGFVIFSGTVDVERNFELISGSVGTANIIRFVGAYDSSILNVSNGFNHIQFRKTGGADIYLDSFFMTGDLVVDQVGSEIFGTVPGSTEILPYGHVTFLANAGGDVEIRMIGTVSKTFTGTAGALVPNFKSTKASGTLTLTGNIDVLGLFAHFGGATLNASGATVTLKSNSSSDVSSVDIGAHSLQNLVFNKTHDNAGITINGGATVNGNLTINNTAAGTESVSGGTLLVKGNVTMQAGDGGTTNITLNGTGAQTVSHVGGVWPGTLLSVNKSSGVVSQANNFNLTNGNPLDLEITAGSWDMAGYSLTVEDNLSLAAGTKLIKNCGALSYGSLANSGTIVEGTDGVTLSIADAAAVTEGASSQFVVSLSAANCGPVPFAWSTADGVATSVQDYTAVVAQAATIPQGDTSLTVAVNTTNDGAMEPLNERYTVTVAGVTDVPVTDGTATGIINSDELFPGVTWTGLGGDNLWSNAMNWSTEAVPAEGNAINFRADACSLAGCDVSIDSMVSFWAATLNLNAGFTGTVTNNNYLSLKSITIADGTFDNTNRTVEVKAGVGSTFNQTGGTFISDGNLVCFDCDSVVRTGGVMTFGANSILQIYGSFSGAVALNFGGVEGPTTTLIRENSGFGKQINVTGAYRTKKLLVNDSFFNTNLTFNSGTIEVLEEVQINKGVGGAGTIKLVGAGPHLFNQTGGRAPKISVDTTGHVAFTGTVTLGNDFTYINAGSLDASNATLQLVTGSGSPTIASGPIAWKALDHNNGAANSTISGTLKVLGNVDLRGGGAIGHFNGGTIEFGGNYTKYSTYIGGSTAFTAVGTGTQFLNTFANASPTGNFTVNKPSGVLYQGFDLSLAGAGQDLIILSGTYVTSGSLLSINDSLNMSPGTKLYKGCGTLSYNVGSSTIAGTIYEGDADVNLSIADAADVTEGDGSDVSQTFVVTASPLNCAESVFDYSTLNGTAIEPGDYTSIAATTVTLPANTASLTITITTKGDVLPEGNEYYSVALSNLGGLSAGDIVGRGVILDNDAGAVNGIILADLAITNITSNDFSAQIDFSGDDNTNAVATLYWCNETDVPGCNPEIANAPYQGSIVMTRGSGVFTASLSDLSYPTSPGETLNVRVVVVDGDGVLGTPLATTFNLLPAIDILQTSSVEGEPLIFSVNVNQPIAEAITFNWSITGGTATSGGGNDYLAASGTATLAAGSSYVLLSPILTIQDTVSEATEDIIVTISSSTNAEIRSSSAFGYIIDNDPGVPWERGLNGFITTSEIDHTTGKRYVVGGFSHWDDTLNNGLVKIKANGSEDLAINVGAGFGNGAYRGLRDHNGRIIVAGWFTKFKGVAQPRIARLNMDGTLDTTFAVGLGFESGTVRDMALQSDGKIVVVGTIPTFNGQTIANIARLNDDGSLDSGFSLTSSADASVERAIIQPDGRIAIGGSFTTVNSVSQKYISRLNVDGTLDTNFLIGTGASSYVRGLERRADGKYIVIGDFLTVDGISSKYVARLNTNGSLDTTFSVGAGPSSNVYALALQEDNKILIGGYFTSYDGTPINRIARLLPDGAIDPSFVVGTGASDRVDGIQVLRSGGIVAYGMFKQFNGANVPNVVVLTGTGTIDGSINLLNGILYKFLQLEQGGLIAFSRSYGGTAVGNYARLNADNTLDTTFNANPGTNNEIHDLKLQSDGKPVICGLFYELNGTSASYVARLNTDGSTDTTFVGKPLSWVFSCAIQPDGKILIGGTFIAYDGNTSYKGLLRLNPDGTRDPTFSSGTGPNERPYVIKVLPSGKILVGGSFSSYNGYSQKGILKLNADGTRDTTFLAGPGITGAHVFDIAIDDADRIIIGGSFTAYNGTSISNIARLSANGVLDTSFNIGTGINGSISAIKIQPDSKILLGGTFTDYNGMARQNIVRVNSLGGIDTTFGSSIGFDSTVYNIVMTNAGKIHVDGFFNYYGSSSARATYNFAQIDATSIGNLQTSNITQASFKATVGYHGDYNENASFTLKWCNQTDNAGCTPANATPMTWVSGQTKFEVTVSGLAAPNDPNDILKLHIEVTDPDGTEGAPLTGTVQLAP